MVDPQLVVMAAGIGSRYGGLKQIDPVGPSGEIVIDYSIYDAIKAGFKKVVFIIRKDIEDVFREKVGANIENKIETEYVFQELDKLPEGYSVPEGRTKPWGTGHAVLCAKDAITAPFAVINADDFYGRDAFVTLGDYLRSVDPAAEPYPFAMVGYILNNTLSEHGHVARGVCTVGDDGNLESIVERTKIQKFGDVVKFTEDDENWQEISDEATVSMNFWGFTPQYLDELAERFPKFLDEKINEPKSEFFVPEVVNDLIKEKKSQAKMLYCNERWFGVTYQDDKPILKQAIRDKVDQGIYPEKLWG